ncbi:AHH domain-containing protein [Myxococcus sp. RHSTA-1-4]|uniref:AHH domain-containing protein n=1 Tax=Myxococcus sp. RHSTA-1-4 TaxID=2874601 RepID=UPI001CBC4498|nr:AHH domain-containing protein [Myxococcus sp. RHSTA-1-4]MBZ4422592.1 AHH domain-containing protein [Myxococcus sp. RHSTA-1-4]
MTSKHESDDLNLEDKHHRARKTTEGGRCLVPYGSFAQQSCSYRWQAYMQALTDSKDYNWDKYKSLGRRRKLVLIRQRKAEKGEKRWEEAEVKSPKAREWDVSEDSSNFKRSCNKPYWFEAHHIIPHSQLRGAITDVGKGRPNADRLSLVVRRGLLEESYNLNHKKNMLILPMDGLVAEALELPKHLATPDHRDHPRYSKYVEDKLNKYFDPVKESISRHKKKIEYRPVRKKLEALSALLRRKIKALGKKLWAKQDDVSLNDINPKKPKKGSLRSLDV